MMTAPNVPLVHQARPLEIPGCDKLRFLPEGPIPLDDQGRLSWVAIQHGSEAQHGSLNVLDLSTMENQTYDLPGRPGFAFACQDEGKFIAGVERSLGIFDTATGSWETFCDGIDAAVDNTIINDAVVFEDNLIFGTKDLAFAEQKAGLYLYRGRDGKLFPLRNDQVCSNGKAVRRAADGSLMLLDIDSPTRLIVQYPLDIDAGTLGDPEVLIQLDAEGGVPDGAVLTPDGTGLIVAIFFPGVAPHGETRLYDLETGQMQQVWQTPGSPQNTCPALVEMDGIVHLVITTAFEHMTAEDRQQCSNAGRLFLAETDLVGPVERPRYPLDAASR